MATIKKKKSAVAKKNSLKTVNKLFASLPPSPGRRGPDKSPQVIYELEYELKTANFVTYGRGASDIYIFCDTLRIAKSVKLNNNLIVHARHVIVHPEGSTIEASGENAVNETTSAASGSAPKKVNNKDEYPRDRYPQEQLHGKDGNPGKRGEDAFNVSIIASQLTGGKLTINARGGKGGRGQNGGKGATPAHRPQPREISRDQRNRENPPNMRIFHIAYYGRTLQGGQAHQLVWDEYMYYLDYLAVIVGYPGYDGFNGGNGGRGGMSGGGGNGGIVRLLMAGELPKSKWNVDASAGPGLTAGESAKHGSPGEGGTGGRGGRHWYMTRNWNNDVKNGWSTDNLIIDQDMRDKIVKLDDLGDREFNNGHYSRQCRAEFLASRTKLRDRNTKSGSKGKKGNQYRDSTASSAGSKITPDVVANADEKILKHAIPTERYIHMLMYKAEVATLQHDYATAGAIYRWTELLAQSESKKTGTSSFPVLLRQVKNAQIQLKSRIDPAQNTCVQALKPKSLIDYTGKYLDKLSKLENRYRQFMESKKTRKTRIEQTTESIRSNNAIKARLKQDIKEKLNREKALRESIRTINAELVQKHMHLKTMPEKLEREVNKAISESNKLTFWDFLDLAGYGFSIWGAVSDLRDATRDRTFEFNEGFEKFRQSKGPLPANLSQDKLNEMFVKDYKNARKYLAARKKQEGMAISLIETAFAGTGLKIFAAEKQLIKPDYYKKLADPADLPSKDFYADEWEAESEFTFPEDKMLNLKLKRNKFRLFIRQFIGQFRAAEEWQRHFDDFFDMGEAKINLVHKLSKLRSARRELTFQAKLNRMKEDQLKKDLVKIKAAKPNDQVLQLIAENDTDLEYMYWSALRTGFELVRQEAIVYNAYTLKTEALPAPGMSLSAEVLKEVYHDDYYDKVTKAVEDTRNLIQTHTYNTPPLISYVPSADELKKLRAGEFIDITGTIDTSDLAYNRKIKNIEVRLAGVTADSDLCCELVHSGLSDYLTEDGTAVSYYLPSIMVRLNYSVKKSDSGELVYGKAANPITTKFPGEKAQIGYSPYTKWKLRFPENFRIARYVYNRNIDWKNFNAIEFIFEVWEQNRD